MESMSFPKLVFVQWYDAETHLGWEQNSDLVAKAPLIYTIGFLVAESDDSIIIASTVGQAGQDSNARILIPLGMIVDVKEFNVPA